MATKTRTREGTWGAVGAQKILVKGGEPFGGAHQGVGNGGARGKEKGKKRGAKEKSLKS